MLQIVITTLKHCQSLLMLTTSLLFALDPSNDLWQDATLELETDAEPPLWLGDENVWLGIRYLHQKDQAEEVVVRLWCELKSMVAWLAEQRLAVVEAMDACSGKCIVYPGKQYSKRLMDFLRCLPIIHTQKAT